MKIVFFLSFMAFLNPVFADRSVSIAVTDGKLNLVNGSDVTVTFTVECFDKTTGANILTGATAVTLASKADIVYESAGTCASGQAPTYKSQNVVTCPGSVNYSAAAALCGAASNICTYNDLVNRGITNLYGFPNYHWIAASADPFYVTWTDWSKSSSYTPSGGGKEYQLGTNTKSNNTSQRCHNSVGGAGAGIANCSAYDKINSNSGAVCCPTNNGFKSCKVTILSATPAKGHLQSPQFKAGASF